MSILKTYSDATGKTERAENRAEKPVINQSPAEDAGRLQAKIQWLESTETKRMFEELIEQAVNCENEARKIACYPVSNEIAQAILNFNLVKAETFRTIVKVYGRPTIT